ncbi:MAG: hypothetical protein ACLTDR_13400 [Adlercreutzia equolifaciens]
MAATAMVIVVPDEAVEALKAAGCIPRPAVPERDVRRQRQDCRRERRGLGRHRGRPAAPRHGRVREGHERRRRPHASLLWPVTRILTANEMLTQSAGLRLMITYLALYIGFIFLVSTAAILAIQQLSQTSDSAPRYRTCGSSAATGP